MKLLEERILKDGIVLSGTVLKVDKFLNHQIDVKLIMELAKEWKRLYADERITKILTIEASGIGIACIAALEFDVPVVYAKKTRSSTIGSDLLSAKVVSYTHGNSYNVIAAKDYISPDDRILIIDDFLAKGSALTSLLDVCQQAGAHVCGAGIVIEKVYQGGGELVKRAGLRVESLAKILEMDSEKGIDGIVFE